VLRDSRIKFLSLAVLVFLVLVILEMLGLFSGLSQVRGIFRSSLLTPATPLIEGLNGWVENLRTLDHISTENSNLKLEIGTYQQQLSALETENARLNFLVEQTQYQSTSTVSPYLAEILPNSEVSFSGNMRIWIEPGKINQGDWVVANGFIIGRVSSIEINLAVVETVYAAKSLLPITISGRGGVLSSTGGVSLSAEEIAVDVSLSSGERLYLLTPSLGVETIPVGWLTSRLSDPAEPAQRWGVTNPVEISALKYVLIYPQQ
jgi:cell shape-determining protein MreC